MFYQVLQDMFIPYWQFTEPVMSIVLRTAGDPALLGATSREVFRLVLGDGLRLTAIGAVVGAAGSVAVGRWLKTLLFGVGSWDVRTLGATAVLLLAVAALACLVPARRAMRVDPMAALRAE